MMCRIGSNYTGKKQKKQIVIFICQNKLDQLRFAIFSTKGSKMNQYQKLTANHSFGDIGRACSVTREAARQWYQRGKLPDTEYLPADHSRRTNHAEKIAKLVRCNRAELL
jgi:hypothetical protein